MAIIKRVKCDDDVYRWLNEHGDRVVVSLYTEFGYIKLDQTREFSIELIDPLVMAKLERFESHPHYVVKTDSHNIFDILKATPIANQKLIDDRWTFESVDEIEVMEGQYQYFGVILDPVGNWTEQVTMKDYYENKFFKSESAV